MLDARKFRSLQRREPWCFDRGHELMSQADSARRPLEWGIWLIVAVVLHVGLLSLTALLRTPAWRDAELLRIALVMGVSSADAAGSASQAASPPAPVVAEPQPRPAVQPKAPIRNRPARRRAAPALPVIAGAAASAVAAPNPVSAGAGESGGHASAGGGTGSGDGAGRGSGNGAGSGGDQRGYCVYCPEPGYPMMARRRGWSGKVDVELVLLADGRVGRAGVMRSSGYEILDQEALDVARRSRFRLPEPNTAPVRGHIEYRFELTD